MKSYDFSFKYDLVLLFLLISMAPWSNANEKIISFKNSDYRILEVKGSFMVIPGRFNFSLSLEGEPPVNNLRPKPKCHKIREYFEMFQKTLNKCIDDNPAFSEDSDCVQAHQLINNNRFGIYLEDGLPEGEIKNDAVQFWKIKLSPPETNEQELRVYLSSIFKLPEAKFHLILDPKIENDHPFKNHLILMGENSLLKRLLLSKGYKSDDRLFSTNRMGDFITLDRVLGCDLLEGKTKIKFDASLLFEKLIQVDEGKKMEAFEQYQRVFKSRSEGSSLVEVAALAGMRFQKIFGSMEDDLSSEEYMDLFKKIFTLKESSLQMKVFFSTDDFFSIFPIKILRESTYVLLEGQVK